MDRLFFLDALSYIGVDLKLVKELFYGTIAT